MRRPSLGRLARGAGVALALGGVVFACYATGGVAGALAASTVLTGLALLLQRTGR